MIYYIYGRLGTRLMMLGLAFCPVVPESIGAPVLEYNEYSARKACRDAAASGYTKPFFSTVPHKYALMPNER